jgi:hypothetical protein
MKRTFVMAHEQARARAIECVRSAPDGFVVTVDEPNRNLSQNAAMWALLTEFSEQLAWPVNGTPTRLEPEDWKAILTAAFRREVRVAEGINGGQVMLGASTSRMTKREFSEFLEFMHSIAAERGVVLDERAAA